MFTYRTTYRKRNELNSNCPNLKPELYIKYYNSKYLFDNNFFKKYFFYPINTTQFCSTIYKQIQQIDSKLEKKIQSILGGKNVPSQICFLSLADYILQLSYSHLKISFQMIDFFSSDSS